MPFVTTEYPTLAIPLLQGILKREGVSCSAFYFAELFEQIATPEIYQLILDDSSNNELGEWFFSRKTFCLQNDDHLDKDYLARKDDFLDLRDKFESTIDDLSLREWDFDIIGFSCTFLQLMPSLCLSKAIKKCNPTKEIIFGGGNMLPEISEELLRECPWIDKVFLGESENSLIHYVNTGQLNVQGIMWREEDTIRSSGVSRLTRREIQELIIPDFDDYYAATFHKKKLAVQIGRGCIYNKCNFCVFCDHTPYRKGSVENSMEQLRVMLDRHEAQDVAFTDLIFPPGAFKSLPKIPGKYTFCISSFTWSYDHLPYLKDQGCSFGIESFHPEILKLLNKEQSVIKCISILKWLKHYSVEVIYMMLYGIIGEKGEWYDEMLPLMRSIVHLPPPMWYQSVTHHRDSSYVTPEKYRICSTYEEVYPESFDLRRIARVYELDDIDLQLQQIKNWQNIKPVTDFVQLWRINYLILSPSLRRYDNVVIDDRNQKNKRIALTSSQIDILEECEYPVEQDQLSQHKVQDVELLLQHHLLVHMENQYLSLVEPTAPLETRDD